MMIELEETVTNRAAKARLNPCSNGMMIELTAIAAQKTHFYGLNPCSNGMMIELDGWLGDRDCTRVLILVLMEFLSFLVSISQRSICCFPDNYD